ncbi:MAG: hypothetical protein WEC00_12120 [Dongiaceae bacterium]
MHLAVGRIGDCQNPVGSKSPYRRPFVTPAMQDRHVVVAACDLPDRDAPSRIGASRIAIVDYRRDAVLVGTDRLVLGGSGGVERVRARQRKSAGR